MGFGLGSLNPVRIVQGKGEIGEALGPAAPVLAGLALGPAGYGLTAMQAGLAVGGISALASGNLGKGLSAGLGAWGGASIGAGLSGMGEAALGDAARAETLLGGGSEAMAAENAALYGKEAPLLDKLGAGSSYAVQNPTAALKTLGEGSAWKGAGVLGAAAAPILAGNMVQTATPAPQSAGLIRPYDFNRKVVTPTNMVRPAYQQGQDTSERNWFQDTFTAQKPYPAPGPEYKNAEGGPVRMAAGGDVQEVPSFDPVVRMADGGAVDYGNNPSQGLGIVALAENLNAATDANSVARQRMPQYVYDPVSQSYVLINPNWNAPAPITTDGYTGYESYGASGGEGPATEGNVGHDSSSVGVADAGSSVGPSTGAATAAAADASTGAVGSSGESGAAAGGAGPGGPGGDSSDGGGATGGTGGSDGGTGGSDGGTGGGDGGGSGGGGDGGGGEAQGGLSPYFKRMYAGGMPYAAGGLPSLGGYASGGNPRLLKGPGDGMSDNIPAVIGNKQPARLADGEFVIPADVVSHLGNGSTEAGAKQLYRMMDRIRAARTGKKKQAPAVKTAKYLPA